VSVTGVAFAGVTTGCDYTTIAYASAVGCRCSPAPGTKVRGMARLERAVSLTEHAGHRFRYRLTGPCALMICWKAVGGSLSLHLPAALRAATIRMFSR